VTGMAFCWYKTAPEMLIKSLLFEDMT